MISIPTPVQLRIDFSVTPLCACGCGQHVPLYTATNLKAGKVRGAPARYVPGHHGKAARAIERFKASLKREGRCLLWTGKVNGSGYGYLGGGRLAHRRAWELWRGPIPKGMCVLHDCDKYYPVGDITNRRCCDPTHLFLGTRADNMRDMCAKGRHGTGYQPKGERHPRARLTEAQAREVKVRLAAGEQQTAIARDYGVSPSTIHLIANGKNWTHL